MGERPLFSPASLSSVPVSSWLQGQASLGPPKIPRYYMGDLTHHSLPRILAKLHPPVSLPGPQLFQGLKQLCFLL